MRFNKIAKLSGGKVITDQHNPIFNKYAADFAYLESAIKKEIKDNIPTVVDVTLYPDNKIEAFVHGRKFTWDVQ